MVADILKSRKDAKLNQMQNFRRLMSYGMYGPKSPATNILTEAELQNMDPQELIDRIHNQNSYQHRILYYGPTSRKRTIGYHQQKSPGAQKAERIPVGNEFPHLETPVTQIFIAPYEAKQIYMTQLSNRGDKFDPMIEPRPARCIMNTSVGV